MNDPQTHSCLHTSCQAQRNTFNPSGDNLPPEQSPLPQYVPLGLYLIRNLDGRLTLQDRHLIQLVLIPSYKSFDQLFEGGTKLKMPFE